MKTEVRKKLANVLRELNANDVDAVVLLQEKGRITWLGNVNRDAATTIAITVGRDLIGKQNVHHLLH